MKTKRISRRALFWCWIFFTAANVALATAFHRSPERVLDQTLDMLFDFLIVWFLLAQEEK